MLGGELLLVSLTACLVLGGLAEWFVHRRRLDQIPIRVHVNGTRGKSSVTRLIAAGLREAGIRTCAKTTGTLPRMIMPDGAESTVHRSSAPNVIEQVRIVEAATECGAEALVVECMAIDPELQWLSQARLIRPTHAVITNVRADHLDVMGPTEDDVAWALAASIPEHAQLFTAEPRHLQLLQEVAAQRGTAVIAVPQDEVQQVSPADLARFSYVEHAENVTLALEVCRSLGVDKETALRGMWKTRPDPGAMTVHELKFYGRQIIFVNGFAANDPESTEQIWRMALDRYPAVVHRIAVVNCREDRPDRSRQFGEACVAWPPASHYVLMGTGTGAFARAAAASGLDLSRLHFAESRSVADVFELIVELGGKSAVVVGMSNIGGLGLELVRYFKSF